MLEINRRTMLSAGGASAVGLIAGCSGGGGSDGGGDGGDGGGDGGDGGGDGGDGGGDGGGSGYPSEQIRMIVPYGEGGGTDLYTRAFAKALDDILGVSTLVDNVTGAQAMNGVNTTLNADTDGYTTLTLNPPLEVAFQLLSEPGFDQRDLKGVATVGDTPVTMIANAEYPVEDDFKKMMELYESGEMTSVGGQGVGSLQWIFAHTAKDDSEIGWAWENYIGYEGASQISQAVASGEIDCGIASDTGTLSVVESGDAVPVATVSSTGTDVFDIRPITESGYPNYDWVGAFFRALFMPPETPDDRIQTFTDGVKEAVNSDEINSWSEDTGNRTYYEGPQHTDEFLNSVFDEFEKRNVVEMINEAQS